jgi:hypothetical protein
MSSALKAKPTKAAGTPHYVNRWFAAKKLGSNRRLLKRWTEIKEPSKEPSKELKFCGNIYGHYFNYKVANVRHKTKRLGEVNFFDCYQRNGFYLLKDIFRGPFLEVIKQEILNVEKPSWVVPDISQGQVKVNLLKTRFDKPDEKIKGTFLHNFLTAVVAGTFPEKKFFEVALVKTNIPNRHEWVDCDFHEDISDAPETFLYNEKSPVTLYFAVDSQELQLDVIPKKQKRGPPPKSHKLTLKPGDILVFDTCKTRHRTASPASDISPDRVNIVMTGYEEFFSIEGTTGIPDPE